MFFAIGFETTRTGERYAGVACQGTRYLELFGSGVACSCAPRNGSHFAIALKPRPSDCSRSATAAGEASVWSPHSGFRLRGEFAEYDAERIFDAGNSHLRIRKVHQRGGAASAQEPEGLPSLRPRLHAADPARSHQGVSRRRMCRLLQQWASSNYYRIANDIRELDADPFVLSCPAPVNNRETIVLGHGSGGRLTAQLIRTCFCPRSTTLCCEQWRIRPL